MKIGQLVIGNVKETCRTFFSNFHAAPVGCIFYDLDFYSSTRDALTLFDDDAANFLPRVFMYFDDIIGNSTWLANEFVGEQLAINEFNQQHSKKKIVPSKNMPLQYHNQWWSQQIYNYHDFNHPNYTTFIADLEQKLHEADIKLH